MDAETKEAFNETWKGFQDIRKEMRDAFLGLGNQINTRVDSLETRMDERFEIVESEIRSLHDEMDTGFSLVNEQFNEVDKRFDAVDKKFGEVDKRLGEVDKRLGEVDKRLGEVDKRLGEVDKRFNMVEIKLDVGDFNYQSLEQKFDAGFNRMDERFSEVITQIDGVVSICQRLDQEDVASRLRYDRLEHRVEKLEARS